MPPKYGKPDCHSLGRRLEAKQEKLRIYALYGVKGHTEKFVFKDYVLKSL